MRWAGHVACTPEIRNVLKILVGLTYVEEIIWTTKA